MKVYAKKDPELKQPRSQGLWEGGCSERSFSINISSWTLSAGEILLYCD